LQLLGTRRFGTFWFPSLLSNIGTWAQQVAQPWLLLSLGASPIILGLAAGQRRLGGVYAARRRASVDACASAQFSNVNIAA
jgi:hypothetical protein